MGKSKFSSRTTISNKDERKHDNRSDRKKVREYLAEGHYEAVPSEQRLKKRKNGGMID